MLFFSFFWWNEETAVLRFCLALIDIHICFFEKRGRQTPKSGLSPEKFPSSLFFSHSAGLSNNTLVARGTNNFLCIMILVWSPHLKPSSCLLLSRVFPPPHFIHCHVIEWSGILKMKTQFSEKEGARLCFLCG